MFKLIVMFFLVTNGVPAEEPFSQISRKTPFPDLEQCVAFLATEAGRAEREAIAKLAESKNAVPKMSCVPFDDGSI